jgi:hypothetical protein
MKAEHDKSDGAYHQRPRRSRSAIREYQPHPRQKRKPLENPEHHRFITAERARQPTDGGNRREQRKTAWRCYCREKGSGCANAIQRRSKAAHN